MRITENSFRILIALFILYKCPINATPDRVVAYTMQASNYCYKTQVIQQKVHFRMPPNVRFKILLTAMPSLTPRVFKNMDCLVISSQTFFHHQKLAPIPTTVIASAEIAVDYKVDGRSDSPGYSEHLVLVVIELVHEHSICKKLVE